MRTFLISTIVATQLFINYSLFCRNYLFEEVGVELVYPNEWKLEYTVDDEKILYAYSPDEDFTLLAKLMNDDSLDNAMEFVESSLSLDYLNVDLFQKDYIVINGMNAIKGEGKLMIDDETENTIKFLLIKLGKNKILYIYGIDYPDIIDSYRKDIEKIMKSIKMSGK